MPSLGSLSINRLYLPAKGVLARLLAAPVAPRWQFVYRLVLATVPCLFVTLWLPAAAPLFVLLSIATVYWFLGPSYQGTLFRTDRDTIYWCITTPLWVYFLFWGYLMLNTKQLGASVSMVFLLVIVCVWPVFRSNLDRTERAIDFNKVYVPTAVFVATAQFFQFIDAFQ